MVKKVFSIIIAMALVLSTLPCNVRVAEDEGAMTPTRIQSEALKFTDEPSFTMPGYNVSVEAVYKEIPSGTVPPEGTEAPAQPSPGSTEAKKGSSVPVEAFPGNGYVFTGWYEDGRVVSTDAKYIFIAEKDRTLSAVFKKKHPGNGNGILKGSINVANNIKTVSQVSLPDGW